MGDIEKVKSDIVRVKSNGIEIKDMESLQRFCKMAVHAKVFKSAADLAKACMIAEYGLEIGIHPATALQNMHMVEGRICMGAGLMAGLIKRTGKYSYKLKEHSRESCTIVFMERGIGEIGESVFDKEDAVRAGLIGKHNWKKYPKAMFYARALSAGARMLCADMFLGGPAHTPEEISDGEYVDHAFAEAWGMDDASQETKKEVFSAAEELKKEFKERKGEAVDGDA